jgi:hypothetical protein
MYSDVIDSHSLRGQAENEEAKQVEEGYYVLRQRACYFCAP